MAKSKTVGERPGPTVAIGGFAAGILPPNPSDAILAGRELPLRLADGVTGRRPFSEPTKAPLHYNDGPGPEEIVSSRRTQPPLATLLGHEDHFDADAHRFGEDANKYSKGANDGRTLGGAEIYGT